MQTLRPLASPPVSASTPARQSRGWLRTLVGFDRRDRREGAVAVEMAVVMTFIFVPMFLGIIEFGRMMMVGQIVTTASRYGARHAILEGSTNREVEEMVTEYLIDSLGVGAGDVQITITITPDGSNPPAADTGDAQRRDLIDVRVGVPWDRVALIPGDYLGGKIIQSNAAMRHE